MSIKEELLKKIEERKANREEEIDRIPLKWLRRRYQNKLGSDEKMREYFLELGDVILNRYNKPISRFIFKYMNATSGLSFFKKQFQLGNKPKSFLDSVVDYYMFASSYGAWPLEIDEVTESRVTAYFHECPVKCEDHLKLCLAATSMEPRLSKKTWFGAKVTFTERIPEGAKRCKVVFEKNIHVKR